MKRTMILVTGAMMMAACGMGGPGGGYESSQVGASSADQLALLEFVNASETTFERLDVECAIRSDSAKNIIKHRDGRDKLPGTADDQLFQTVEELDGVSMVGDWTMSQLYVCATRFGYLTPGTCVAETFDGPNDGEYVTAGYYSVATMPPALANLVETLKADAVQYAYRDLDVSLYPIRFAELTAFAQNDVTVGYEVRFVQTIDPECGVQLHIRYTVDSCFRVRDAEPSI